MSRTDTKAVRTADNVRGLTVYQPHAALIVLGEKSLETRDWIPGPESGTPEGWTGTLLICSGADSTEHDAWMWAALSNPKIADVYDHLRQEYQGVMGKQKQGESLFSSACIIGAVDLVSVSRVRSVMCPDCAGMETIRKLNPNVPETWFGLVLDTGEATMPVWAIEPQEHALGIYEPGRYVWKLENPRRLPIPIPFVGRRRLFEVPEEILLQIEAQGVKL